MGYLLEGSLGMRKFRTSWAIAKTNPLVLVLSRNLASDIAICKTRTYIIYKFLKVTKKKLNIGCSLYIVSIETKAEIGMINQQVVF